MALAFMGSLKTYHRFISWSRKGIWALLVGFFITLLCWSFFMRVTPQEVKFVNLKSEAIIENHMEKPHFSSLNAAGEPYEIWAEKAKNITIEQVDLINPQGKITTKEGRLTKVKAAKGHYTKEKHFLTLRENVHINDMLEGYTLTTDEALVDLKEQKAQGNLPVRGEGPTGSFWGKSFQANHMKGDLMLYGPAHLVMLPQKKSRSWEAPLIIDAAESIDCVQEDNRCTATKQAKAQRGDRVIFADQVIVHFAPGKTLKDREVIVLEAQGHVRCEDPSRTAFGERAFYTVADKHVLLTGKNLQILSPEQKLTATQSLEYFDEEKKAVAKGNAIFIHQDRVIQADELIAYFKATEEVSPQVTPSAESQLALDFVVAKGNVLISTPHQIARGNRGRYDATTACATLEGKTEIVQGKNLIQGGKASIDLKKNVAVMQQKRQRVQALLVPRDLKQQRSFFKKQKSSS